jgi:hypothetical protein
MKSFFLLNFHAIAQKVFKGDARKLNENCELKPIINEHVGNLKKLQSFPHLPVKK